MTYEFSNLMTHGSIHQQLKKDHVLILATFMKERKSPYKHIIKFTAPRKTRTQSTKSQKLCVNYYYFISK